jgi:hypothetical protein
MRTLSFLLPGLLVCGFLINMAGTANNSTPALQSRTLMVGASTLPFDTKTLTNLDKIPSNTCDVSLVNGGNYVLATPTGCKGVRVAAMTIAASAKSCAESAQADFSDLTNTTLFKGDFGFYLGQDKPARCLVVREMWGRYV